MARKSRQKKALNVRGLNKPKTVQKNRPSKKRLSKKVRQNNNNNSGMNQNNNRPNRLRKNKSNNKNKSVKRRRSKRSQNKNKKRQRGGYLGYRLGEVSTVLPHGRDGKANFDIEVDAQETINFKRDGKTVFHRDMVADAEIDDRSDKYDKLGELGSVFDSIDDEGMSEEDLNRATTERVRKRESVNNENYDEQSDYFGKKLQPRIQEYQRLKKQYDDKYFENKPNIDELTNSEKNKLARYGRGDGEWKRDSAVREAELDKIINDDDAPPGLKQAAEDLREDYDFSNFKKAQANTYDYPNEPK
jgi:hypothetical protein